MEEIRANSKPDEWSHVPSSLSPADDVSHGLNLHWLWGPEFLWQPESLWSNADLNEVSDSALELKKEAHTNHAKI